MYICMCAYPGVYIYIYIHNSLSLSSHIYWCRHVSIFLDAGYPHPIIFPNLERKRMPCWRGEPHAGGEPPWTSVLNLLS